jgi:hypothetical protein
MSGEPDQPIVLLFGLDEWAVTLRSGQVAHIRASGYARDDSDIIFTALAKGSPNYLVEIARIPQAAVQRILGGSHGSASRDV